MRPPSKGDILRTREAERVLNEQAHFFQYNRCSEPPFSLMILVVYRLRWTLKRLITRCLSLKTTDKKRKTVPDALLYRLSERGISTILARAVETRVTTEIHHGKSAGQCCSPRCMKVGTLGNPNCCTPSQERGSIANGHSIQQGGACRCAPRVSHGDVRRSGCSNWVGSQFPL
jgi:hypothetical protein